MKNSLLSLLTLLISVSLSSQITLTRDNSFPQPGDSLIYNEYVNFSPIPISDENGSTWDYSNVQAFSDDYEVNLITAPTEIAGFELANMAYLDQYDVIYREVTDTKAALWGFASPQDNTIYSDAFDEIRFPMSLGDNFEDTFTSSRFALDGTLEGTQTGSATVEARAEGLLILPYGTEVQTLKVTSESSWFLPDTEQVLYTIKIDTWYDGVTRAYLAQSTHYELTAGGDLDFFTFLSEEDFTLLNVSELETAQATIYPNPSSDWIQVESTAPISTYDLMTLQSKTLQSEKLGFDKSISITELPAGTYLLRLHLAKGTITKKIIVE